MFFGFLGFFFLPGVIVRVLENSARSWAWDAMEFSITSSSFPGQVLDCLLSGAPWLLLSLRGCVYLYCVRLFSTRRWGETKHEKNHTRVSLPKAYFSTSLTKSFLFLFPFGYSFQTAWREKEEGCSGILNSQPSP